MSKKYFVLGTIFLIIIFSVWAANFRDKNEVASEMPTLIQPGKISEAEPATSSAESRNEETIAEDLLPPLSRASERITKKKFGTFVTPQDSPVRPERFRGYHNAADFEIFPGEESIDVPVKAVCSGNLATKKTATGYGGVVVESCEVNGEPITVVYGHLKLASVTYNVGDKISAGDTLGILGQGYSAETSGERKHLHLGFHKGAAINILGYVQNQAELSNWLDPCQYVCGK